MTLYLALISVIRLYDLALGSYVLALGHFLIEALVFRTAGFGPGLLSPLIVACECRAEMMFRPRDSSTSDNARSNESDLDD